MKPYTESEYQNFQEEMKEIKRHLFLQGRDKTLVELLTNDMLELIKLEYENPELLSPVVGEYVDAYVKSVIAYFMVEENSYDLNKYYLKASLLSEEIIEGRREFDGGGGK